MALITSKKITKINKNSRVQKETNCTYNVFNVNETNIFNLTLMAHQNERVNQNRAKQFSLIEKQQSI